MSEPLRLIYLDARQQIRINTFLSLCILAVVYLVPGSIYAWMFYPDHRQITDLVIIAGAALLAGGLAGSLILKDGRLELASVPATSLSDSGRIDRTEWLLILGAFALIAAGLAFYIATPANYLELDKVERSGALRKYYALRIAFFMSPVVCYLGLMRYGAPKTRWVKWAYTTYLFAYGALALVELNREMMLALGFLVLCWLARFRNYFPAFFPQQMLLVALAIILFASLKGLAYPLLFGKEFESGLFAIGEVTNWVRWTHYAFTHHVDLGPLHANDLYYALNAFVFPQSFFESASAIWFRDVLGNFSEGQTYGYSGLLSWYSVGGVVGVVLVPMLLGFLATALDRASNPIALVASFGFALVAFRFFRSEYVLVLKTFLWQYFYPGLVFLAFSRLRFR